MKNRQGKTERLFLRLSKDELGNIRRTALEAGMDVSEFVRLCLAAEIARKTMEPAHMKILADQFRAGVEEWVRTKVDHEVAKAKAREKKRA